MPTPTAPADTRPGRAASRREAMPPAPRTTAGAALAPGQPAYPAFKETLRGAFNAVWSALVAVEAGTNVVVTVNPEAERILRRSEEELRGRDARLLFRAGASPDKPLADFSGLSPAREVFAVGPRGRRLPVLLAASPFAAFGRELVILNFMDNSDLIEARTNYRSIFEHAVEGIFQSAPTGRFIRVNPALANILGYASPEEMVAAITDMKTQLYVNPEDRDRLLALLSENGRVTGLETRFFCKDGSVKWIAQAAREVRDEHGDLRYIEGLNIDITRRKQAEGAVRESEARYRAIVEDQSEHVCRYKSDGTFVFVNDAFAKYFGKAKEDLVGHRFAPRLPEEDRSSVDRCLRSLTPLSPVAEVEHRILTGEGEVRWLHRSFRAFFDEAGSPVEYQVVGRDVTDRVKAEENLKRISFEKEQYRLNLEAVFRSIPDAVVVVDKDMRVLHANRAMEEICCISGKLVPGSCLSGISGSCNRSCFEVLFTTLQTRQSVLDYHVECATSNPGKVLVINSSPLLDREYKFMGAVLVMRDITRLVNLERQVIGTTGYRNIVGKSKVMADLYPVLDQLADVDATVLVTGESGTGKELVAEALHHGGHRAKAPLIKVNCSALAENLLESELFGHVRGAFTGAVRDKIGRFQAAEGGTIFLDEIGDIPLTIQIKLLRVLEQKEYERVGDYRTQKANVRVITATNVDLRKRIEAGLFREDLYYRLKVMGIHLPPLRDRAEDIPLLCAHFLNQFNVALGKKINRVADAVMQLFMNHAWPGNIRELRSTLEHASILCPGGEIRLEHLPREFLHGQGRPKKEAATPTKIPADRLLQALAEVNGNKAKAARLLGIDRRTLYRNLDRIKAGEGN